VTGRVVALFHKEQRWACDCRLMNVVMQYWRRYIERPVWKSTDLRCLLPLLRPSFLRVTFSCHATSFLPANLHPDYMYSVSQKIPPEIFWHFIPKRLGIFSPNFTRLLNVPIYAALQIFIQLPATLTKLCHIKRDHHNVLKMSSIDRNARWVATLRP